MYWVKIMNYNLYDYMAYTYKFISYNELTIL